MFGLMRDMTIKWTQRSIFWFFSSYLSTHISLLGTLWTEHDDIYIYTGIHWQQHLVFCQRFYVHMRNCVYRCQRCHYRRRRHSYKNERKMFAHCYVYFLVCLMSTSTLAIPSSVQPCRPMCSTCFAHKCTFMLDSNVFSARRRCGFFRRFYFIYFFFYFVISLCVCSSSSTAKRRKEYNFREKWNLLLLLLLHIAYARVSVSEWVCA